MLLLANMPGNTVAPAAIVASAHAAMPGTFQAESAASPPISLGGGLPVPETAGLLAQTGEIRESFDWSKRKTVTEFNRLEQAVLADADDEVGRHRYAQMKRDRHATVFADRFARDYAEVRRLQLLSVKLAEVQRFLRPAGA